ncbi:MAG: NAD-dependent epimerase/dehydratase family protein, partial [Bacteroidales bacterium]|nr:NAD-dependent epimerase/dehydratase family protein [Bacteroidales bacterium]
DNFNLETSHVLPAMIRKMHLAKLLENGDFKGIKNDLQKRPFSSKTKYNSNWKDKDIIELLKNIGITFKTNSKFNTQSSKLDEVTLTLWGSGSPYREFLHVDDLTSALLFLMKNYSEYGHVNIGIGNDLTIKQLAEMIKEIVAFKGIIEWDITKPDGTPRKLLDVGKLHKQGWKEKITLFDGIKKIYKEYKIHGEN